MVTLLKTNTILYYKNTIQYWKGANCKGKSQLTNLKRLNTFSYGRWWVNTFTKNSCVLKLIKMQQNLYVAKIVIFVKQEINKQTKNSVYAAVGGNRMSLCRLKLVKIGCDVSTVASRLCPSTEIECDVLAQFCYGDRLLTPWRYIAITSFITPQII